MRTIIRKFTAGVLVTCSSVCILALPSNMPTAITGVPSTLLFFTTAAICGIGIATGIILAKRN